MQQDFCSVGDLSLEMQVKNTFIHFQVAPDVAPKRCNSCTARFADSCRLSVQFNPESPQSTSSAQQDGTQLEDSRSELSQDSSALLDDACCGSPSELSHAFGCISGTPSELSQDAAAAAHFEEASFEQRLKAIGCRGCGCVFAVLCPHALKGRCNKARCRYCHCNVVHGAGTGFPAAKQSTRTYIERLCDGELSGRQYLTFLGHVLGGADNLSHPPMWLQDEDELKIISDCLVNAFVQKCRGTLARRVLVKVCRWIGEARRDDDMMSDLMHIMQQMEASIETSESWGWYNGSSELQALRADALKETDGRHLTTKNWPKVTKTDQQGLPSSPWFGVFTALMKMFAWELFFHSPRSPVFQMDNILGCIARDVKSFIVERIRRSPLSPSALLCLPRQNQVATILHEAQCVVLVDSTCSKGNRSKAPGAFAATYSPTSRRQRY